VPALDDATNISKIKSAQVTNFEPLVETVKVYCCVGCHLVLVSHQIPIHHQEFPKKHVHIQIPLNVIPVLSIIHSHPPPTKKILFTDFSTTQLTLTQPSIFPSTFRKRKKFSYKKGQLYQDTLYNPHFSLRLVVLLLSRGSLSL
jgi:hypothetical protein